MVHLVTSRFRLGDVCPMAPAHGERREASKVATSAELLGSEGFPSGWVGAVCGGFFVRLAVDKGNDDDDDDFWLPCFEHESKPKDEIEEVGSLFWSLFFVYPKMIQFCSHILQDVRLNCYMTRFRQ